MGVCWWTRKGHFWRWWLSNVMWSLINHHLIMSHCHAIRDMSWQSHIPCQAVIITMKKSSETYFFLKSRKLSKVFCCCHIPAVKLTLSPDWLLACAGGEQTQIFSPLEFKYFSSLNIFRAEGDRKTLTVRLLLGITRLWHDYYNCHFERERGVKHCKYLQEYGNSELVFHVH